MLFKPMQRPSTKKATIAGRQGKLQQSVGAEFAITTLWSKTNLFQASKPVICIFNHSLNSWKTAGKKCMQQGKPSDPLRWFQ